MPKCEDCKYFDRVGLVVKEGDLPYFKDVYSKDHGYCRGVYPDARGLFPHVNGKFDWCKNFIVQGK